MVTHSIAAVAPPVRVPFRYRGTIPSVSLSSLLSDLHSAASTGPTTVCDVFQGITTGLAKYSSVEHHRSAAPAHPGHNGHTTTRETNAIRRRYHRRSKRSARCRSTISLIEDRPSRHATPGGPHLAPIVHHSSHRAHTSASATHGACSGRLRCYR